MHFRYRAISSMVSRLDVFAKFWVLKDEILVALAAESITMCSSRKYSYSHHMGLEFPGGWGFCKAKKFKEMYEA